jgi:hypothetical protein
VRLLCNGYGNNLAETLLLLFCLAMQTQIRNIRNWSQLVEHKKLHTDPAGGVGKQQEQAGRATQEQAGRATQEQAGRATQEQAGRATRQPVVRAPKETSTSNVIEGQYHLLKVITKEKDSGIGTGRGAVGPSE